MTTTKPPRPFTLRNVRLVAALSEETDCFQATVYVGDTRVGTAENRGTGGQTSVWIDAKVQPPTREEIRQGALQVLERLATPDDRDLFARYPEMLTVIAVDLLLGEWQDATEKRKRAERIRRKEMSNARAFLGMGMPYMVRCETAKEIVWYGLRDASDQRVADAKRACAAKYGPVQRAEVKRTQAVLDQAVPS